MSSLTQDLQKIYNTKLQIKEAIGTSSDVFEDYPELIANMASVTPTGYVDIITNGDYNIATYAYAYVNVPQEGGGLDWDDVAGYGYIVPAGFKSYEIPLEYAVQYNINVATYAYAYVKNAYMYDYLDSLYWANNIVNGYVKDE